MSRKPTRKVSAATRLVQIDAALEVNVPQLRAVLGDEESFISLHIKMREDASMLAVLKAYGPDGGPLVCFGVGYGIAGCFLGLEGSIAGNRWRVDKPWHPESG